MKNPYRAAYAFLTALAVPVAAQDEVKIGSPPDWVEPSELMEVPGDPVGLVYFRRQDTFIHLNEEGQTNYVGQRVKLLHPQALQFGNIQLVWNPASGNPTVHAITIHRGDETIDVLADATFDILRREDNLEQAILDGLLTAVFQVPDLRIDDELELAFSLPANDPTLSEHNFGLLTIADNPSPGRFKLGLSWEDGSEPRTRITDDFGDAVERTGTGIFILLDNPGIVTAPKNAPPRYSWMRYLEYTDYESWRDFSRTMDPLYREAAQIVPGSSLDDEARRIAANHSTAKERAAAALHLVQRQVRYIYVGLNGGNLRPATAEETWQRRYGDCKGKTALLLALLDYLEVDAEAVLASNAGFDDGLPDRLPGPAMFDHVLVRATVDGQTLWMDGTLPEVALASTRPVFPYRHVLPLSREGSDLVAVAQVPSALPDEMGLYNIDASAGFDEPARTEWTSVKRGPGALAEYVQFSAVSPAQLEEAFRSNLAGSAQWDTIEKVAYRFDKETGASILTVAGTGPVDWDEESDGGYDLVLPGGGFSPPNRKVRASEEGDAPFYAKPGYSCHATTVRVPEGDRMDRWSFNTTYDTMMYGRVYYRMMEERDDGTIRMVRGSRVEKNEISPARAERDNGRLDDFDNTKAIISYEPAGLGEPWGNLSPVPAVSEFDWAGPNPPCLPADMLNDK